MGLKCLDPGSANPGAALLFKSLLEEAHGKLDHNATKLLGEWDAHEPDARVGAAEAAMAHSMPVSKALLQLGMMYTGVCGARSRPWGAFAGGYCGSKEAVAAM